MFIIDEGKKQEDVVVEEFVVEEVGVVLGSVVGKQDFCGQGKILVIVI